MNLQSTDPSILQAEALAELASPAATRIKVLEAQLEDSTTDTERIDLLKQLSSTWYEAQQFGLAGYQAEQIAELNPTGETWAIAGTTYAIGIKNASKTKEQLFCKEKALECLEKAASLEPEVVSHQLNRGILLAENPPADNPMKGVQLLLQLNKKHPQNVRVINNIAKFALQTGQLDKAEQRLLGAISIEPNNKRSHCLLAELYSAKDDIASYKKHLNICES
ncbi:MAG: tetratricopeptide repeat protein [Bacteroidota bacterium]